MNRRFSQPLWHLVDAKNRTCGRLATQIVTLLRGKHKPNYTPWYDCGDYVVVVNAKDVHFTGDKFRQKNFIWHTGYPGGLKKRAVRDQLKIKPEEVLRKAVMGMFAKNNLRHDIGRKLRIFPGALHLHEDKLPPGTPSVI